MNPTLAVLAAAGMMLCAPAYAGTYGPPAPVEAAPAFPDNFDIAPEETLAQAEARHREATRSAWGRFWIGQGMAATDIALTCIALAKRNPDGSRQFREGNPLYGRNANCGRVAAIRGGISVLQYFLARRAIRADPVAAKKTLTITIAIQGIPVLWNAVQLAK